jgi:hypothetical protein
MLRPRTLQAVMFLMKGSAPSSLMDNAKAFIFDLFPAE